MKRISRRLGISLLFLGAFVFWTIAISCVDVRSVGPQGSSVGLAGINQAIHELTGVHLKLYNITDWLGLVPIAVCISFGILGLSQWIRRKSLRKIDVNILLLGGFYGIVIGAYLLFENVVINYRPVLIDGELEASYPSSTTLLVMCVMPTAAMQLRNRIQNRILRNSVTLTVFAFVVFMVAGRLVSGVHWFTDIVGGMLLSAGLVGLYATVSKI